MTVDDVLAKLDPKLRKKLSAGTDIKIEKIATPSHGLNHALRGGLALGRQVLVWGNKSSGKSSFCLQMIAGAQAAGKQAAWIDAESSFDPAWATRLGVDPAKLIYSNSKTVNDMVDVSQQLMSADVDIIVVDSISALLPAVYFEKDSTELKDLVDTKQIGAEARDMTNAVKMLNYANKNTLLVLISQQRNNLGGLYASHMPTGGMAVKFFSSTIIKLWSSDSDNNAIKGQVHAGNKIIEAKVGRKVSWHIDFNKTGPAFVGGEYDFYFDGDNIGVDTVADLLDTAIMLGKAEQGGAWIKLLGESINGRAKAIEFLKADPDRVKRLMELVYE